MNARRITAVATLVTAIAAGVCVFAAGTSSAGRSVQLSTADLARMHARVEFSDRYEAARARVPNASSSATARKGALPMCAASRAVVGQGASCRTRDGLYALADAPGALTHGPDLVSLAGVHTQARRAGTASDLVCSGASRTHHVLLVYLLPKDFAAAHGDRFAEVAPQLRQELATASAVVADRAAQFQPGARRRIRVACGADGAPVVARIVLPRTAEQYRASSAGFGAIIADLDKLGVLEQYPDYQTRAVPTLRRIVGYYDADFLPGVAGQGTLYRRASLLKQGVTPRSPLVSRTVRNLNNTPPQSSVAVAYGTSVAGVPEPPRATSILHELSHTMGAVQNEVPTTSLAGHCIDGLDVMCYDDGGPNAASYTPNACPGSPASGPQDDQLMYDCNGDTYFHPAPPLGNPLAGDTVWNLGSPANQTLAVTTVDAPNLAPPVSVRTSGTGTALRATWSPPPTGSAPAAYEVIALPVDSSVPPIQSSVTGRTAALNLAPRTTYDIVVAPLDALAAAGAGATIRRTTGVDTTAPARVVAPRWAARRRGQIRLNWSAVRDNVGVVRYSVERAVGGRWRQAASLRAAATKPVVLTPWINLPAGTRQRVRVVAIDARGNRSLPGPSLRVAVP